MRLLMRITTQPLISPPLKAYPPSYTSRWDAPVVTDLKAAPALVRHQQISFTLLASDPSEPQAAPTDGCASNTAKTNEGRRFPCQDWMQDLQVRTIDFSHGNNQKDGLASPDVQCPQLDEELNLDGIWDEPSGRLVSSRRRHDLPHLELRSACGYSYALRREAFNVVATNQT